MLTLLSLYIHIRAGVLLVLVGIGSQISYLFREVLLITTNSGRYDGIDAAVKLINATSIKWLNRIALYIISIKWENFDQKILLTQSSYEFHWEKLRTNLLIFNRQLTLYIFLLLKKIISCIFSHSLNVAVSSKMLPSYGIFELHLSLIMIINVFID